MVPDGVRVGPGGSIRPGTGGIGRSRYRGAAVPERPLAPPQPRRAPPHSRGSRSPEPPHGAAAPGWIQNVGAAAAGNTNADNAEKLCNSPWNTPLSARKCRQYCRQLFLSRLQ